MIHPTAHIDDLSEIPNDISIGAFCVIEKGVQFGSHVILDSHVILKSGVILGDNVHVHAHVVLGDIPQIMGKIFDFESGVLIGARTIIREGVTVHRASQPHTFTQVGNNCLLMAFSHVGHDGIVGNHCVLANQVLLAGYVTVQDYVFLSGGSMIHQHVHIGESAMISGNAEITMHVPPFVMAWARNNVANLNIVGLQRRNFLSAEIADVKKLYRFIYDNQSRSFKKKAEQALNKALFKTCRGKQFLEFFIRSKPERGFIYPRY